MKRLVVLVGLPGSGKTAFGKRHPEWATVSRDAIRREIFHCNYAPEYEDVVDRVFAAALVEVIGSDAEVVCVDDLNLSRSARRDLIELAELSGREAVAHVMPGEPADALLDRARREAARLSVSDPRLRVIARPATWFAELARSYDPVDVREGFARVTQETELLDEAVPAGPSPAPEGAHRRKRVDRREPLPLFVP